MLQSMGSQRAGHKLATKPQYKECFFGFVFNNGNIIFRSLIHNRQCFQIKIHHGLLTLIPIRNFIQSKKPVTFVLITYFAHAPRQGILRPGRMYGDALERSFT